MSSISADNISKCANCGKGSEGDDSIQLKSCAACKMVKYCSRECQAAHRPQHKKECKKRAAELHEEALFKQPLKEDCPICFLRMPSLDTGTAHEYMSCCGKVICSGCIYANTKMHVLSGGTNDLCPFCRAPAPKENSSVEKMMKRIAVGDVEAMFILGCMYSQGTNGLPQDRSKALELWHQAGELGFADANLNIGNEYYRAYLNDDDVAMNMKKTKHYYELAAMGGNAKARYNLGAFEQHKGNTERALKHWMIAVRDGVIEALENIKQLYTKEDYAKAVRAHQAYLDEVKSEQRDEAAVVDERFKYY